LPSIVLESIRFSSFQQIKPLKNCQTFLTSGGWGNYF